MWNFARMLNAAHPAETCSKPRNCSSKASPGCPAPRRAQVLRRLLNGWSIKRIARDLTIMIVEHDMEVVMGLAHVITVLHYGEVLAEGPPAEIQANPRVQEVYLKT